MHKNNKLNSTSKNMIVAIFFFSEIYWVEFVFFSYTAMKIIDPINFWKKSLRYWYFLMLNLTCYSYAFLGDDLWYSFTFHRNFLRICLNFENFIDFRVKLWFVFLNNNHCFLLKNVFSKVTFVKKNKQFTKQIRYLVSKAILHHNDLI